MVGNDGCGWPDVRETRGARGRDRCVSFAARWGERRVGRGVVRVLVVVLLRIELKSIFLGCRLVWFVWCAVGFDDL